MMLIPVALDIVIMKNNGVTSEDKMGTMTTFGLQCMIYLLHLNTDYFQKMII